ncbi:MAG: DUF2298 domain-containing protein [Vicinamibacterales bacterium]
MGDDHPHLLSMPIVVASLTSAFALMPGATCPDGNPQASRRIWGDGLPLRWGSVALGVLVAASLLAINTWDLPAAMAVVVVAAAWPACGVGAPRRLVERTAVLAMVALAVTGVVFAPYLASVQSPVQGVRPNLWYPTPLGEFLTMFGALLPGVALLVWLAWLEDPLPLGQTARAAGALVLAALSFLMASAVWSAFTDAGRAWMAAVAPGIERPLAIVLARWVRGWPVLVLGVAGAAAIGSLLRARLARGSGAAVGLSFGLLLAGVGLGLVLVPELAYVHDVFATRMNTVFKFYYQAWLYFAVAGALAVVMAWQRGDATRSAALAVLGISACGLVYPVAAIGTVISGASGTSRSLDALVSIRQERPDTWAAIEWVRGHTPPDAVIALAPGTSYRLDESLLSTATGRPTLRMAGP